MPEGDTLELEIGRLSFGRGAVATAPDGRVVFVENAAPEDRVRALVVREHPRHIEARAVEVLTAGPHRIPPPCPHYEACGGCPWQHVDYPTQISSKRASVIDNLQRIGKITDVEVAPTVASPQEFGYRNRIKLRFERGKLGFYRAETNTLAPIDDCMIAEPRIRTSLAIIEKLVGTLETGVTRVEIASRGLKSGLVLAINGSGRLRKKDSLIMRAFIESSENEVTGAHLWGRGWSRTWGETDRLYEVADGVKVSFPGASFGQVNTSANELLVAAVTQEAQPTAGQRIIELYAGSGNFTFALAPLAGRISAVDADTESIRVARETTRALEHRNVGFHEARAEVFLADYDGRQPDVVLVDPPRNGLGKVAGMIADMRPARIVYVSCNSSTLARDAAVLVGQGYKMTKVQPFDLFPHTFHVETVSTFELT
jgi:23S rRNA (uracil1939-C5)-methyltransferase